MRRNISTGSEFEKRAGYSRAVVVGDMIFVAGTTGYNYDAMTISEDPAEQARQTFRNIEWALKQAGASLKDVVRATYYVKDMADWPAVREVAMVEFADILPAATAVQAPLASPTMKIEIECTAVKAPAKLPLAAPARAKAKAKKPAARRAKAKAAPDKPRRKAAVKAKPAKAKPAKAKPAKAKPAKKAAKKAGPARKGRR
ncbi:MAG: RidA family protein [Alphaproteobacteria bacterium]|nr:RidA family protein [Alphaproteobacteria bacterium]